MLRVKKKCYILVLMYFTLSSVKAQIVNIERARMQSDTTGWMGSAGASISLNQNVTQIFSTDLDAHIQYKSKKSLFLFLGSYGFLKGDGKKLIDNTFFHFRYNYKITPILRWEVFTQLQQNVIANIRSRYLIGTGPRFKILSTGLIRLYAATLIMYEREKEKTVNGTLHSDFRSSSYISFTITPDKMLEIISTTFFQPLLNNWNDYRILNQASLRVKAGKKFSIRINWNYLNDSYPVAGIPSVNYTLSTGFNYDF